ncbi:MAG: NUDIX domain-containing protein [Chloroflexi bacterium]|nr:NUDIX domain-containing protein [Chloroflexota bacterium]
MDIFSLLDTLQTIALNGLRYTTNEFDKERYERLLKMATHTYGELLAVPDKTIRERFLVEIGHITPKVGTDAAIFNENGEILLLERADGSGWCLPCGFVEPNETPVEGIIREVREETGLEIKVNQLVGVFTRKPSAQMGLHTTVSIVHLCEIVDGQLETSHEGHDLKYWAIDNMKNWHATHEINARAAYKMWKAKHLIPAISA